jgi:hypothetical protein
MTLNAHVALSGGFIMSERISDNELAVFFITLFKFAGDSEGLHNIVVPLANLIDRNGYREDAMRFLRAALAVQTTTVDGEPPL